MYLFSSVEWRCAESDDTHYFGRIIRLTLNQYLALLDSQFPLFSSP